MLSSTAPNCGLFWKMRPFIIQLMQDINGVKIYNLTAGRTEAQIVEAALKKGQSLRYNEEYRNRFQIIQDFQFPSNCVQVQVTADQQHVIAAGGYGPQMKIFDLANLSQKCMRGMDSQIVKFAILQQNYKKIAFACMDRTLQFHTSFGRHFKTRVPKTPRDIHFIRPTATLTVAASDSSVYRLCLEQGKFLSSIELKSNAANCLTFNSKLSVLLIGTENGLQIWDCRERASVISLQQREVKSIGCDQTGLGYATGSFDGRVNLWDIRQNRSIYEIQNHYQQPVNTIAFHQRSRKLLSSTKTTLNIHDKDSAKLYTRLEPKQSINRFQLVQDSGLILLAQESQRIGAYFVPSIDKAPRWIPHLQNMTEELEEQKRNTVYQQFKFILPEQVDDLECHNLLQTRALKPHLHGYLIPLKLYRKLLPRSNLLKMQKMRDELINRKLQDKQVEAITNKFTETKVNKEMFEGLAQEKQEKLLADNRFKALFNDERFKISKTSEDYMLHHPNQKKQIMKLRDLEEGEVRRLAGKLGKKIKKNKK